MSFLESYTLFISSHVVNIKFIKKTLQVQNKYRSCAYTDKYRCPKRMSPILLSFVSAGITVEAAIAVPLFLFFTANLLSIISSFNTYGERMSQAQQNARTQAFVSTSMDDISDDIVSYKYTVSMAPYFDYIGYSSATSLASMSYKKWNGYNLSSTLADNAEEEYVYVTEYGYSYHRNRGCSHLNISIEVVSNSEISNRRNNSKARYYPCEKCGGNSSGLCFITSDGDKYHSSSDCSGLKRNIKMVRLSEVGGKTPCSDCGG